MRSMLRTNGLTKKAFCLHLALLITAVTTGEDSSAPICTTSIACLTFTLCGSQSYRMLKKAWALFKYDIDKSGIDWQELS